MVGALGPIRVAAKDSLVVKFWLEILTSFCFFPAPGPEVVNFRLKSLLVTTFAQSKQICSFDDGDTHTRSIDLVGVCGVESTHSVIEVEDSQMKPETPDASHATPHFWREMQMTNENPSSETSRPLATSSLAVGRFAAKQGSLRSPRGRLVASLQIQLSWFNWGKPILNFLPELHQLWTYCSLVKVCWQFWHR